MAANRSKISVRECNMPHLEEAEEAEAPLAEVGALLVEVGNKWKGVRHRVRKR